MDQEEKLDSSKEHKNDKRAQKRVKWSKGQKL